MTSPTATIRRFTGWHMFAILVVFFGVVIVVNVTMATLASRTYGGQVVENSYVASQNFNHWLDEAAREKALGWKVTTARTDGGRVAITLSGTTISSAFVTAVARHPVGLLPDQQLHFTPTGPGRFISHESLPAGRWRLRIEMAANGTRLRTETDLQ